MTTKLDGINWQAHARVDKFTIDQVEACRKALGLERDPYGDELRAFCTPDSRIDQPGNLLTTTGLARITALIIGTASTQAATNGATRIGVGTGTTAAVVGNTTLGGASKYFMTMDTSPSNSPTTSNGVITFKATFGTSVANFAWEEWAIDITNSGTASAGTTGGDVILNRKVASLGTKTSAASWAFTATITLS